MNSNRKHPPSEEIHNHEGWQKMNTMVKKISSMLSTNHDLADDHEGEEVLDWDEIPF